MNNKCPFCGSPVNEKDRYCTSCGEPNAHYKKPEDDPAATSNSEQGSSVYPYSENTNTSDSFSFDPNQPPKTIEELRAYAYGHNLPLDQMRFFIGENYTGARAFGIYEENGEYIVYKNKSDGSRAVRYKGPDQEYAVNELYQKMRSEVLQRKKGKTSSNNAYHTSSGPTSGSKKRRSSKLTVSEILSAVVFCLILGGVILFAFFDDSDSSSSDGYYYYNDDYYYRQGSYWFEYDEDSKNWNTTTPDSSFLDNYSDYYYGYNYSDSYGASDFGGTDYYHNSDYGYYEYQGGNDDDDDDYNDWGNDTWDDNDTWDAGGTDWDSDW